MPTPPPFTDLHEAGRPTAQAPSQDAAVAIHDVTYRFAQSQWPVLKGVNLTLARGEFVILTGPSGAGKTTLMTLVGALRRLQNGHITVLGQQLSGLDAQSQLSVRRRIGFIFQDHNLFDALSAFETLWLAMSLETVKPDRAQALHRAEAALAELGLADKLHSKPGALSTGQKQRVAIARALIHQPPLILADEPTASLDHASAHRVIDLLKSRVAHGASILMVTHDNRIFAEADRVVHMVDGRIDHVD